MFQHPIPPSSVIAPSSIDSGPIAYPFVVGCAGRCGKLAAVHFPVDAQLRDLASELSAQGWRLAMAEFGSGQLDAVAGVTDQAVAPLCGTCASDGRRVRRAAPVRASTVRR